MIIVLRVEVDPATDGIQVACGQNMNEEQIGQVLAASATAWARNSGGTPRAALERALRVLLDNPDAIGERSRIILPGSAS